MLLEVLSFFDKFRESGTTEYVFCQIIGYVGMAFVLIGFLFKNIKKVRLFNVIGCVFTIVYALLDFQFPTLCLNTCLLIINSIYLLRYRNKNDEKKPEDN